MGHKKLVTGHLEKVRGLLLAEYSIQVRDLIRHQAGVYALYRKERLYYVGLAKDLPRRLKQHLRDRHNRKWDKFSVYLTADDGHTKELESMLLRIAKPPGNKQSGKFVSSCNLWSQLNRTIKARQDAKRAKLLGGPMARRRRRQKATRARGAKGLGGLFDRRTQLRAEYKGYEYRASLRKNGEISYAGKIYASLSAAGNAITKRNTNGWTFWRFKDSSGDWVPLKTLRK